MKPSNIRLRIGLLWLNLLSVTGCLARFWWLCANPDPNTIAISAWVAPERWLPFGLMLHAIAICLLVMNLVVCMRLRGNRRNSGGTDVGLPPGAFATPS